MVRRHARGGEGLQQQQQHHYGPALQTVSGNYVAAKRKGVVGGVDYQLTGVVRFVQAEAVHRQLAAGCVVLLSNLGYSAAGETLNCDIYTGGVWGGQWVEGCAGRSEGVLCDCGDGGCMRMEGLESRCTRANTIFMSSFARMLCLVCVSVVQWLPALPSTLLPTSS